MTKLQASPGSSDSKRVEPTLIYLGDFLHGLRYFGKCPDCGSQHMSTHDRGRPHPNAPWQFQCAKCAMRAQ